MPLSRPWYNVAMRSRRLILCLILLTLLATCLAAAAKLRATPKYDRVQVGMDLDELFHPPFAPALVYVLGQEGCCDFECYEGRIQVLYASRPVFRHPKPFIGYHPSEEDPPRMVTDKSIKPRGPLERLAWLAGWR